MHKLTIFIPSYNRAMQLHLLLESLIKFLPSNDILDYIILVCYDGNRDCYQKLIDTFNKYNYINFVKKTNSHFNDFMQALKYANEYILLITDDSVIRDTIDLNNDKLDFIFNQNIISLPIRCGFDVPQVIWNDSSREVDSIVDYEYILDDIIKWTWRTQKNSHFAHPLPLDGFLSKKKTILTLIKLSGWHTNYGALECNLNDALRNTRGFGEYCASFINSKLVNIPINITTEGNQTYKIKYCFTIDELNDIYMQEYKIDLDYIISYKIVSVQQQIPLQFIRK